MKSYSSYGLWRSVARSCHCGLTCPCRSFFRGSCHLASHLCTVFSPPGLPCFLPFIPMPFHFPRSPTVPTRLGSREPGHVTSSPELAWHTRPPVRATAADRWALPTHLRFDWLAGWSGRWAYVAAPSSTLLLLPSPR